MVHQVIDCRMRMILPTLAILLSACVSTPAPAPGRWWKGNLHTHSLWSDGADFPEMIATWYSSNGYNFLAVTEHDMLQEGNARWVDVNAPDPGWPPRNASAKVALPGYRDMFATSALRPEERVAGNQHMVRLRGLSEYRGAFERPDSFLLIMSEEITDKGGAHLNAHNVDVAIQPRGGANSAERIRNNIAAVEALRASSQRNIISVVNHPNYVWTLKAEEIANIPGARLFEVYNGHTMTNSAGDSVHPGTDQMWDVMLTMRHESGGAPIYGLATDDAHDYRAFGDTISMPGRGWVMVRAAHLTPDALLSALSNGDFYASTGVTLRDVRRDRRGISIAIAPQANVAYRTQFIGTRRGGPIGEVLLEVDGLNATYKFKGDERYVRAKVVSSRAKIDPVSGRRLTGKETAWIQPVLR
jgi:hypothetical protein